MNAEEKRQYSKEQYYLNKEKILEKAKERYNLNKDVILKRNKEWKDNNPSYMKEYRETHKEEKRKYENKYLKEYRKTPMGRAKILLSNYNRNDRIHNRGKGDLTAKWIVENIFSKPCAHCGKEGWQVIGCNRIDNSKPHSKDNVEPCCRECNIKLK